MDLDNLGELEKQVLQDAVRNWDTMLTQSRFPLVDPWDWHKVGKTKYRNALKRVVSAVENA
jgi:asparagine synthetase A